MRRLITHEAIFVPAIIGQWPLVFAEIAKLATLTTHAGTAKFPSVSELKTEIQSWLLADSVTANEIDNIVSRAEAAFEHCCNVGGVMEFPFNATVARYIKPS